jgi:hypothetical protein
MGNLLHAFTRSDDSTGQARLSSSSSSDFLEKWACIIFIALKAIIKFTHRFWSIVRVKQIIEASPLAFLTGLHRISHPNLGAWLRESKVHEALNGMLEGNE